MDIVQNEQGKVYMKKLFISSRGGNSLYLWGISLFVLGYLKKSTP